MANLDILLETVKKALGADLTSATIELNELTIHVSTPSIISVLTTLRDHPGCLFTLLLDICGVDYPQEPQRFRVVYHLLSLEKNHRIRVKVSTDDSISVPSVTSVFSTANWYERETWDLYGIQFSNHPDMRRLLTDYNFEGHPLRKDFPLTGYVQVRYDTDQAKVIYEPVSLSQEFRVFDFLSPWEGILREPAMESPQSQKKPA